MYYTVRQLAQMADVAVNTIRLYSDHGILPCYRDASNRRIYNDESVESLKNIQLLRNCGLSIADIKRYQELCFQDDPRTLKERYLIVCRAAEAAHDDVRKAKTIAKYADVQVAKYEKILKGNKSSDAR